MPADQFDWAAHIEAVAANIFGSCNTEMSREPEDVRFGGHGSVSINYETGIWYDHEGKRGGGVRDLIRDYKKIEDRDAAIAYAEECQRHFENGGRPKKNGGSSQYHEELEAIYLYRDASGNLAFEVVRFVFRLPGGGYVTDERGKRTKKIRQRRASGEWGLDEHTPVIPYQLPDLIKAVAAGHTICIPEGEPKVDLIRSFGFPATCCSGGAGKWRAEHSAFLKGADIVLLADNDQAGRDHIELIAASLAPSAKRIRICQLPGLPEKGDVIDWHKAGGSKEDFARLVGEAPNYTPDESTGPQPLMRPLPPPEPFPLKALGPELAGAAQAICDVVQAPLEMCVAGVLASASLAVSAYVDVTLPTGQTKPTSCWFWSIAESGERKTTIDDQAHWPQKQREKHLHDCREVELEEYEVSRKIWEARNEAIKKQYKGQEVGSEAHQKELKLLGPKPEEPLLALLTASDFTFEGLVQCLRAGQPLYGIIGSEGGQFIGGHGMTDESKLRTITGLSAAWDGQPIKRVRAKETVVLYGRRVGMHLMVQPEVVAVALGDELLTKQGFTSRILMCTPISLIGTRMHKEAQPEAAHTLQQFKSRVLSIMEEQYPLVPDKQNELAPREVSFSAEAKAMFWQFADAVEKEMAPGGEYESIRSFAAKLPEHAARLGATIAAYRDLKVAELNVEDFQRGMQVAVWYASEAKRLCNAGVSSSDPVVQMLPRAQKLLEWLHEYWKKPVVSARDMYRHGPNSIRNRKAATDLANILVDHGWLTPVDTRRRDTLKWGVVRRPAA
jgi:hypothetical protein